MKSSTGRKFTVTGNKKALAPKSKGLTVVNIDVARKKKQLPGKPSVADQVKSKLAKLAKKTKKVKAKGQELRKLPDLQALVSAVETGKVAINKRSLSAPESDNDFRLIHIHKIAKLTKIAKGLENEILGPEANNRLVYALGLCYDKIDSALDALQDLKTLEQKVEIIGRRILEPMTSKLIQTVGEVVQELKREAKTRMTETNYKKFDDAVSERIQRRTRDFQDIYDQTVDILPKIVEEQL